MALKVIYLLLFFTLSLHASLLVNVFDNLEIPGSCALEMQGQWLRTCDVNWKYAVKCVSKFKFALVELVDQINRKLIYWIDVLKIQVIYILLELI